jgi:Dolichyl-phosphate-mannose-protein mannosyltransferase
MPASGSAIASTHDGLLVGPASRVPPAGRVRVLGRSRIDLSRWSVYAWGSIGTTIAFLALTCWWLTQDRSIPIYDAGDHLLEAFYFHQLIQSGNFLGPFNYVSVYPPLGKLVGTLGTLIGGVNVASPIISENLVFVPLLALGCYQTGRLLFDARAGMLAVIFALGSSLLIALFHVFMLDAPETAMVAVAIWLILASKNFARVGVAAMAGVAVGLGLLIKVQFADCGIGLVLVALAAGGWRNMRGFGAFTLAVFVVAGPWYLDHLSLIKEMAQVAGGQPGVDHYYLPPLLSIKSLTWYFWSTLNYLLLAPLFIMAVIGALWMIVSQVRRREGLSPRSQLLFAAFISWLMITFTPLHDIRYSLPLTPYLAVIGTGWIVYLPRPASLLATAVVVCGALANTLGSTFGVGAPVGYPLPAVHTEPLIGRVVFYTNRGFLVAGPHRDGNVPGLFQALRRNGVRSITWNVGEIGQPDFSEAGLNALAFIYKLSPATTGSQEFIKSATVATLIHAPVTTNAPPTCTRESDGTGVWVARYDAAARHMALYCPTRRPQFYDAGAV